VLVDVLRRTALERNVVRNVDRVNHINRIPGAHLSAMLAADAPIKIDVAKGLQ
jgi:hypothetical protein